mgnify:CR=1 FL=1|tara:strand:+ start:6837 stop:7694 length:858 start_codon:yes stop_codon:yes gene_type:complete
MPACIRGVTFPVGEIIQSLLADRLVRPVLYGEYTQLLGPNLGPNLASDRTQDLLRILVDRLEEQLQACGVSDAGDEKSADIGGLPYALKSEIMISETHYSMPIRLKEILNGYDHTFSITVMEAGSGSNFVSECNLRLKLNKTPEKRSGRFHIRFSVGQEREPVIIKDLEYMNAQNVLERFDPLGTGYEFFTPDQARRFADPIDTNRDARHLFPEDLTLTSPEIRQYPNPPTLLSRLRGEFRENRYPDQTEAFKAFETRMRRDDQGGDSKRRRMEWAVGAMGYALN